MEPFEEHTQVFIVRIWREPREIEGATLLWRGAVEHVASGERCYVQRLNEITRFIARCSGKDMQESGARARLKRWLTGRQGA